MSAISHCIQNVILAIPVFFCRVLVTHLFNEEGVIKNAILQNKQSCNSHADKYVGLLLEKKNER